MSRRLSSFTGEVPKELDVSFSNLNVSAGTGENAKTILQNVSGYASPGSLLALMGATGSGKTTMLSVLSNRLDAGTKLNSPSKVRYGDYVFSKSLKRLIGFVEQDDVVIDSLTVRQSLMYTAKLRMGDHFTEQEKKDRVCSLNIMLCGMLGSLCSNDFYVAILLSKSAYFEICTTALISKH